MIDKDIMDQVTNKLNSMTDKQKAERAQSLKKLMDEELKRRKLNPKKPKKN